MVAPFCGAEPMDAEVTEHMTRLYLTEIRSRLEHAAGVGRAADACASAGFHQKGLEVALVRPAYELMNFCDFVHE